MLSVTEHGRFGKLSVTLQRSVHGIGYCFGRLSVAVYGRFGPSFVRTRSLNVARVKGFFKPGA